MNSSIPEIGGERCGREFFFERRVGALPPIFTANFVDGVESVYGNPKLTKEGVKATQEGLKFTKPGESFVEVHFTIDRKLQYPFNLFINPPLDPNVLVTMNGEEVPSDLNVTDLIHEGENVVRIAFRESADSSFTLAQVGLSRRMNVLKSSL